LGDPEKLYSEKIEDIRAQMGQRVYRLASGWVLMISI
jgi:hypothetical protein